MTDPDPQPIQASAITDATVREQARNIVLGHAKSIEYMSIGETIADYDEFSSLPKAEFERVQGRIDKMIRNAMVTVSWPDEQAQAGAPYCSRCRRWDYDGHWTEGPDSTWLCGNCHMALAVGADHGHAQPEAAGAAAARVRAWLDEWSFKVQGNLVVTGEGRSAPDGCTELTAPDIDALLAERDVLAKRVAELEGFQLQAEHAIPLLADLTDPDPCWYDHHGGCQTHGFLEPEPGEKCPHSLARAFLAGAGPTLREWQAGRDADARAVEALLDAWEDGASMAEYKHAFVELRARFADRIAALDARTTDGGAL